MAFYRRSNSRHVTHLTVLRFGQGNQQESREIWQQCGTKSFQNLAPASFRMTVSLGKGCLKVGCEGGVGVALYTCWMWQCHMQGTAKEKGQALKKGRTSVSAQGLGCWKVMACLLESRKADFQISHFGSGFFCFLRTSYCRKA